MKIHQKIVFQILSNTINGQQLLSIEDQEKAIRKQKAESELIEDAIIEETK